MKVRYSDLALRDVAEAVAYVRQDSPRAAARLSKRIQEQVRELRRWPFMGRKGDVEGTRELVISRTRYKAIYLLHEDHIEITRVVHGAREWPEADGATRPVDLPRFPL